MANLVNDDFHRQYGNENGAGDLLEVSPLDMHFVVRKDSEDGLWLVFDTLKSNAVIGVHESETLAVLDASKREQDA